MTKQEWVTRVILPQRHNEDMSTAEQYVPQNEAEKVFAWRAQCLYDAGCRDIHSAKQLALSDCDIHRACEMLKQGCAPKLAAKILA